jgi:acetyl esterase/lipase
MTPWHEDDLRGRLLKLAAENPDADQWDVIALPAIAEGDLHPDDPRQPGDPLWPAKYPLEDLIRRRAGMVEYDWASLYQVKPAPSGGGLFKEEWFADKLFSKPEDRKDPRIDLISANLQGLPPVTLINARIDPLRSDSDLLAAALKKAGIKVEHRVYDGVTHEFFGMAAVVTNPKEAQAFAGQQLKLSLNPGAKPATVSSK